MSAPREELVTDFESLKLMEHIIIRPCAWCEKTHHGRLLKRSVTSGMTAGGAIWTGDSWEVLPGLACQPRHKSHYVSPISVKERRVWRVVEDEDKGVEEGEERELELVTAGPARK